MGRATVGTMMSLMATSECRVRERLAASSCHSQWWLLPAAMGAAERQWGCHLQLRCWAAQASLHRLQTALPWCSCGPVLPWLILVAQLLLLLPPLLFVVCRDGEGSDDGGEEGDDEGDDEGGDDQ